MQSDRRPRWALLRKRAVVRAGCESIRLVVAMRARLDRDALALLLETQPDLEVAGRAGTGDEVVSLCLSLRPRVLILGVHVPWPREVSGIEAIRMCAPQTRVLAIAPHASDRCVQLNPTDTEADGNRFPPQSWSCLLSALRHGADGAIHRDVACEELFQAVRAVARGERWVGEGIEESRTAAIALSDRERAVALMTAAGRSNKEIAAALRISEGTVKKHIGHALSKLDLHDRLQLGLFVARHPMLFETP